MFRRTFAAALPLALLALPTRAQAAKKLVVYTSNDSTLNELVFAAFKAETGIEVEPVAAGSGVVMRRLQAEKARPLGDIIWGVSRSLLQTNKALFEPYVSKNMRRHAGGIPRPRQSVDRQQPAPAGDPAEHQDRARGRRPEELGRPARSQMEGQDRLHRSGQLGLGLPTVTMLVDLWGGGEAGWKKVAELFKNMKVLNRSSLVFQGVGNGEYPLGISLEYAGPLWAQGGAPVKVIYPADGTTASMEGVAIIKGGPNTENAKVFVDYINRKDVREMILKATFRRPTRDDLDLSRLPGGLPPLSQVKLVKYDEEGWTEKRTKTLEQIKDVLQDCATFAPCSPRRRRCRAYGGVMSVREPLTPPPCGPPPSYGDGQEMQRGRKFGVGVDHVDRDGRGGEFFTLLGPSGCGKTTLLRMIAGFCELDSGEIRFGAQRIDRLPAHTRDIGMVFQNYAVFPNLTVAGNVAYGLKARKVAASEIAGRVERGAGPGPAHRLRRALAAPALRRPAAEGRHRPRAGHPSAGPAVRRAALQPRRAPAGQHAHRDPRAAEVARHHRDLRHPRPGGGDVGVRPHRPDERRSPRAGRHPGRHLPSSGLALCRGIHGHDQPRAGERARPQRRRTGVAAARGAALRRRCAG